MSDEELIARLRNYGHVGTVLEAADRIEVLVAENAEHQQCFDMQWAADMRAIKMWQEAQPGNDLVWPDGAKLSAWLMERVEALVKERDKFCADWGDQCRHSGNLQDKLNEVTADRDTLAASEKELSDAYLRIRAELRAYDTKPGGHDRFQVTEAAIDAIISDRDTLAARLREVEAERDGLLRAAHDNHEADKRVEAAEAEVARLTAEKAALVEASGVINRVGPEAVATVLILDIAAALQGRDRVVLTTDENSLGPRILEFAAILKGDAK